MVEYIIAIADLVILMKMFIFSCDCFIGHMSFINNKQFELKLRKLIYDNAVHVMQGNYLGKLCVHNQ